MNKLEARCNTLSDLSSTAHQLLKFRGDTRLITFSGEMGSGKTTFIREICRQMGVGEKVSSPTFSLVNEYRDGKGQPVYHFDFYRIKNENEAVDIGCEEYFYSGYICLVEWPEKILNLLPKEIVRVRIDVDGESRLFTFQL